MKSFKLTKKMLKDPESLLKEVGAIYENAAKPDLVFMNRSDYKILEKNLTKAYKKKFKFASDRKIKSSVQMELLNLGPVDLETGVQKGYVLFDNNAMNEFIENERKI